MVDQNLVCSALWVAVKLIEFEAVDKILGQVRPMTCAVNLCWVIIAVQLGLWSFARLHIILHAAYISSPLGLIFLLLGEVVRGDWG